LNVQTSEEVKFDEIMAQNEKLIEYIASDGKNANELFKLYYRMGDMYSDKNRTKRALLWFEKALEWVPSENMALYLEHVVDNYLKNPESFRTIQSFSIFFDCFLTASSLPLDLISPICEQITKIRTETNDLDAAIRWYKKLSNVWRKTPRDIRLLPLYECLADTYKLKGLYSLAELTYQDIFFMASQVDVHDGWVDED
jgi:tetratricopeptide (TPR) repeat protein